MLEKGKKRTRRKAAPSPEAPQGMAPPKATRAAAMAAETPASRFGAISAEERHRMISEAAYFRAQRRGFRGGDPDRDWAEAESEIDALLLGRR